MVVCVCACTKSSCYLSSGPLVREARTALYQALAGRPLRRLSNANIAERFAEQVYKERAVSAYNS